MTTEKQRETARKNIRKAQAVFRTQAVDEPGHSQRVARQRLAVARYIVASPLRTRLVERLGDYPLWDAVWL